MNKIGFLFLISLFSTQSFARTTPEKIGCYSHGYSHYIYVDTVNGAMRSNGDTHKVNISGSLDTVLSVADAQNGKVVLNLSGQGKIFFGDEGNSDDKVHCKDCGSTFDGCYTEL